MQHGLLDMLCTHFGSFLVSIHAADSNESRFRGCTILWWQHQAWYAQSETAFFTVIRAED
jgi:hypothetical protein